MSPLDVIFAIDRDIILALLVSLAAAAVLFGVAYPVIDEQARSQKRSAAIMARGAKTATRDQRSATELQKRKKIIAESLQEVENRTKKKLRPKLEARIIQAGLNLQPMAFMSIAVGIGLVAGFICYILTDNPLMAAGVIITLCLGAPNWFLDYLRKRRIEKFVQNFPPTLETIVRGVRAGLPLNDCFNVIASEAQEPVRGEFRNLIESMAIGLTLGEAAERLSERIPIPETTFFSIVLAIQEKTGGNLGETLSNLAAVLRDRKKLREKIKALSAEATISAAIIGSLPFLVIFAIYMTTPDYLTVLFTTNSGKLILGGGLLWMGIGIFIMKQMINFDI